MRPLVRFALAAALLLAASGVAQAKVLDSTDATRLGNEAAERWAHEHPVATAVHTLLANDGVHETQAQQIEEAIDARAKNELRRYAQSLAGQSFATPEDLRTALANRERILRFDIVSSPRAFAQNRPMSWVATDAELGRLSRGLVASWIEHEPSLREKLDEMVTMQDLDQSDVAPVRGLARARTIAHVKTVLAGMRNAQFFSAADANYYVDTAFDEEIDRIRIDSLGDPLSRAPFLEEARNAWMAGQSSTLRSSL